MEDGFHDFGPMQIGLQLQRNYKTWLRSFITWWRARGFKNKNIAKEWSKIFWQLQFAKFISLVDKCDLVITAVTMAMHITIGLNKNNSLQ